MRGENQLHENDIGREVMDDTTISPRGSVSYDIRATGGSSSRCFGGRSYHQLPQEAVNQFLMDQFNGYNGYERRLYCAPALIAASAAVPAIGCQGFQPGYTRSLGFVLPGLQWDLVDRGVFDSDLEAYYKDEAILGWEWQFSQNWAIKAEAIWWEVDNLIGSTTQLAQDPATAA